MTRAAEEGLPQRARLREALRLGWSAAPGSVSLLVLLAAVGGLLPPAGVWALKVLLDELATGSAASTGRVMVAAVALAGASVAGTLVHSLSTYATGVAQRAVQLEAQDRLFRRVNAEQGIAPFEDPAFLNRLRLADQAGQSAPEEVMASLNEVVRSGLLVAGYGGAVLVIWPPMLALVLLAAVPAALLQRRLGRARALLFVGLSPIARRQVFFRGLLTDARAAKEVRLFGLGDWLHARMTTELRTAQRAEAALDRRVLRTDALIELIGAMVAIAATVVAAWQALAGRLTVGDVAVFLAAVAGIHGAVGAVTGALASTYETLLMFGHYQELVAREPDDDRAAAATVPALTSGLMFDDVWFRYSPDGPWVLRGVTLTIPHGLTVGLVGVNGAGKSTLIKLLCRLYEPTRGTIRWDGVDLRELDPVDLRSRIAVVFQDFMAYDLTAAENVGIGRLELLTDLDSLRAAARDAGVDPALSALPAGYRTMLSRTFDPDEDEGSALLSGGQWQRLAIARAFLRRDADLMILDEPSSGLDARAEEEVHRAMRRLRAGRTGLLVSHRLSTLRDADVIHVLDGGRVVEHGDHAQLMAAGGVYAELFLLQAAGYRDDVPVAGA